MAQNVIAVRSSTMDAFRAKTALWTTSGGLVDATTNFRPLQSNPSCISKCAGSDDLEYCPDGTQLEEEGLLKSNRLMPLWISLGVLVAILLVMLLVRCSRTTKQKPLAKPRPPRTEMTKVPTVRNSRSLSLSLSALFCIYHNFTIFVFLTMLSCCHALEALVVQKTVSSDSAKISD